MASLDGIAARIADDLDDHPAWMVLADGLLERSDERGRWINLTYDDDRRSLDERLALEARLHQGGPGGFRWPGARLSRRFGFVLRVHVPWNDDVLEKLAALNDHPDGLLWRSLSLSNVPVAAIGDLCRAPFASRLRTLTLAANDLGDAGMVALSAGAFPSLGKLDVQKNQCTAKGLSALLEAPFVDQLHTLRLRNNPLGPAGGERLGAVALPALRTLDLTDTELTDSGLRGLGGGPLAASISALWLGQNALTGAHLVPFTAATTVDLTNNPTLTLDSLAGAAGRWTSLKLDGCALNDADLPALIAAPKLQTLSMGRNPNVSAEGLGGLEALASLRSLNLSGCGVTTPGWLTLASLSAPLLQQLRLDRCAVGTFDGTPRDAFPALTQLSFASNPLNTGASSLAEVEFPSLRRLVARQCGVILEPWRRAPWFARLEELDVGGQPINLRTVSAARSLIHLNVSRCGLSDDLDVLWSMPELVILDCSNNPLSNVAVFENAGHPHLRQLNLASCGLDDTTVTGLADGRQRFPRLQHLNLRANALSSSVHSAIRRSLSPVLLDVG